MTSLFKYLDVSDLPAPEPLEKILELLSFLRDEEIICMTHRQIPLNLFKILVDRSFCYRLVEVEKDSPSKEYRIKLYIWNQQNPKAVVLVQEAIKSVQ